MDFKDFRDRRILVTGATGFIGRLLTRRLVAAGAAVHGTSRQSQPETPGVVWHAVDLAQADAAGRLVRRVAPDAILHLASFVAGARELAAVLPAFQANLASTVYLLAAAEEHGVSRFVQAGSLEEPAADEPLPVPSSPYAAAKAGAASYLRMFHALYGTPVVHARIFMVYGPGQLDLKKLIPYVILARLRGEEVRLSSGTRPVDWVFVDDVVEGLLRLVLSEGVEGQTVDLGTGQLHTVRDVVEKLYQQLSPGESPIFGGLEDRAMEQVRQARVDATEALLGWRPTTSLDDGLAATIDYYRQT